LILIVRFSHLLEKICSDFNVGKLTLNQRVPGSSPGAPTIKSTTQRFDRRHSDKQSGLPPFRHLSHFRSLRAALFGPAITGAGCANLSIQRILKVDQLKQEELPEEKRIATAIAALSPKT
jgi:hypothetical protein